MTADPLVLIEEVDRATARLLATARTLDGAVAAPSLLPGWTRGHVLAHIARNADGCVNVLTWARTGVETPQYASAQRREADIEAGAARPLAEHLEDLAASAERFREAVAAMPPSAWSAQVRWLSGTWTPAARAVWSRLREVEVHHVDVDAGYRPEDWPAAFTHRLLHEVAVDCASNREAPAMRLRATDLGHDLVVGAADAGPVIRGPGHALAAWLTGRAGGDGLTVTPDGPLPPVPTWR